MEEAVGWALELYIDPSLDGREAELPEVNSSMFMMQASMMRQASHTSRH
jgi:hypothetical protein